MKFIILLLLIPLSACSSLLENENLMQKGNVFYYENLETKANGYVKVDQLEGEVVKHFEDGFIKKVEDEKKTSYYQDSYLSKTIDKRGIVFNYNKGRLKEEIKEDFIYRNIKEFEFINAPDNVYLVYKRGLVSSEYFTIDNKNYLTYFSDSGVVEKTIVEHGYTRKFYIYDEKGKLTEYYSTYNGFKQGEFFQVEDGLYTFGMYNNNNVLFTKTYDHNGQILRAKDYKMGNLVTFYEFFSEDSISLIGYLTHNFEKIGRWTYFYKSGNTMEYREFVNDSIAIFNKYYEDGVKKASGTINVEKNHYIGILKKYYNNGELQSIEEYSEEGKLQSGAQYFDEKGYKLVKNNENR